MIRSLRAIVLGIGWAASLSGASRADEAKAPAAAPEPRREDQPQPFVPLHPRTAQEQDRIDAMRLYAAARSLEDRRRWTDAIDLLEQALQKDPDSVAIPRRLSRLCFALGRTEQAIAFGRKVVEADPQDAETTRLLVTYYRSRGDLDAAEALLRGALASPALDKKSPAALVIRHDLGLLLAGQAQFEEAADALAPLIEALDDRAANGLSPAEQKLILEGNEAETYRKFGVVFLAARRSKAAVLARRSELAVTAFRRGLVYEPDNAELPRLLAQALVQAGRPAEALEVLEPVLKRHPQGREDYDALALVLTALNRPDEIIPRLEAAAKADPKDSAVQYALADRYREAGRLTDANRLYKQLLTLQVDPEGFGARSESLRKAKRIEDLLKLFESVLEGPSRHEAVLLQIEAISTDPSSAEEVLAAGLKMLEATPPRLGTHGRDVLVLIATKAKKPEAIIALGRLAVRQDPSAQSYLELYQALSRNGRYDDAAATIEELLAKFPDQKMPTLLGALAISRFQAGKNEAALEAAREALKLDPNDLSALQIVGSALSRLGRHEEAIAHYQALLGRFAGLDEVARLAHSGLSNVYVNMGDLDKAEAELEGLLEKDPDDAGINNDLGYLYADRGKNLEKAEEMIRKAVQEEPNNGAYLDSLGWVLFKRGKAREAVEPLEKAVQELGSDPTLFDHLGDVYFQLQEFRKAKATWQRAEEMAAKAIPPDKRLPEIRKKLEALKALGPLPPTPTDENP
jgi:tetratricopeptide (TPR) repeat protein